LRFIKKAVAFITERKGSVKRIFGVRERNSAALLHFEAIMIIQGACDTKRSVLHDSLQKKGPKKQRKYL
jgi:hypothetical protein